MEDSSISNIGIILTILMGLLILGLPKKTAVIPLLIICLFITLGQVIEIAGFHMSMLRIVILFGFVRMILFRIEIKNSIRLNTLDKLFLIYVACMFLAYFFLRQNMEAVVNRLGFAYDAIGLYFLFRIFITDEDQIFNTIKILAVLIIALAIFVVIEYATNNNLFSVFGGVHEVVVIRDGRIRCQGPFRHPIMLGTFGATSLPLLIGAYLIEKKYIFFIGILCVAFLTFASGSGGPVMVFVFVSLGLLAWKIRYHMRLLRWGIFLGAIMLHLIMNAPIWFLIGRLSSVTGGTGYHRSKLIDQAINYFDEWWLFGTSYTAHWMPYVLPSNPDMVDITNMYIRQGVDGGIIAVVLFILILSLCFKSIGVYLKSKNYLFSPNTVIAWGVGVSLFGHCVAFISVRYFDQIIAVFYMILAMVSVFENANCGKTRTVNNIIVK